MLDILREYSVQKVASLISGMVVGTMLSSVVPAADLTANDYVNQYELRVQITPKHLTMLSAEIGAKVDSVNAKEGQRFQKGQPLISFDCVLQSAQRDKAEAVLIGATNAWKANERLAKLNAVGQVELINSETEVKKAKAELAYLNATLDKCLIKAPFTGVVSLQKVTEQQYVQPGTLLMEIIDDSELELELVVPSNWLSWLRVGHPLNVYLEDTVTLYPAKVSRIGAKVDPISQTVKAVAKINGHYPELRAGMSGYLALPKDK